MKKVLFLFVLLVSVMGLSSCSDDETVLDVNQLEGTWGLVSLTGYYYEDGEKISYNENYNPFEPTNDCEKITIEKIGDNKYQVTHYEYTNGNWRRYYSENIFLEGDKLVPENMEGVDVSTVRIVEASSDKLVVEGQGEDEDGAFYDKYSYQRME